MTEVEDSHQQNSNAMSKYAFNIIMHGCLDIAEDVQQSGNISDSASDSASSDGTVWLFHLHSICAMLTYSL